jgi:hypothetical protein
MIKKIVYSISLSRLGFTSRASITVPTPTVNADVGTFVISLSKNRALAMIVSCAKVLTRVRDTKLEPKYF